MTKECPLCGEMMRIQPTIHTTVIPGTMQKVSREVKEWKCPECDYFEEVDEEELVAREKTKAPE